jgi:hypothetical protein
MNTSRPAQSQVLDLVEIIDLKWLLAHEGCRIHVERLQADAAYACECLTLASRSPNSALRELADKLRLRLAQPVTG